jgi:hypothetical protein
MDREFAFQLGPVEYRFRALEQTHFRKYPVKQLPRLVSRRGCVQGCDKRLKAHPAPVNAMVDNESVHDVHDLDQVYLVALWRHAGRFPSQLPSIGKKQAATR